MTFVGISTIITFMIVFNIYTVNSLERLYDKHEDLEVDIKPSGDVDPLEFWKDEMARANNTDLNYEFGDKHVVKYTNPYTGKKHEFEAKEIEFQSPNWRGKDPITLHGYLLYPEELKSKNPACLCMHGLNGNANASFEQAFPYLEKGFIVLCHSHPGHGKSEGAQPTPENFYNEDGKYYEDTHYYLTLMGAIQGLRLLENLTEVNKSQIMVTGGSYGALNTMWLASIAGERIAGAIPYIAIGDIAKNKNFPTKLLYWVWGHSVSEIPDSFWKEQIRWFDPKYYLKSDKLPPIMWQIGTNDEFFAEEGINGTLDAVQHDQAFIQIYPDGHHGLPNFENTTKFFIDYILNGGSAPPKINVKDHKKDYGILGDTLSIEVEIDSERDIKSIQVCYKYLDIIGSCWQLMDLKEDKKDVYKGVLHPGIITSNVHYYIIITLKGDENIWFSSKIYTPGVMISNSTIPYYIGLIAFIAIPIFLIVKQRYRKEVLEGEENLEVKEEIKKSFIIETGLLTIINSMFFLSILLPWAVFESGNVSWNHIYVMNNLFTWTLLFGVFSTYLTLLFFISWILTTQLSLKYPMLMGFFKAWYPIFIFLLFGAFAIILSGSDPNSSALNFGSVYPGLGLYMMLFSSISLIILGIWKRKYQTKLGLRIPKTKWYNIDRWFRIKSQTRVPIPEKSER